MRNSHLKIVLMGNAFPLAVGILALVVWGLGDLVAQMLAFRRQAILDGDWWRVLSGHWVHRGYFHLGVNLLGLALVWHLFGAALRVGHWIILTLIVALGQSLSLLVLYPSVQWFEGMSGLLHGLLVGGALLNLSRTPLLSGITLIGLAAKLLVEAWSGASSAMTSALGGQVLVQSHQCGAIAGLAASVILSRRRRGLLEKTVTP